MIGTRPEALKMAPVIRALRADERCVRTRVCVTGQHREMLTQVLDVFGIVPDVDLDLMQANQSLSELTSRALSALDEYLTRDQPNLVLVQGDTTTAFCAALSAFYHRIPIGHIEAGLRTWNMTSPWPEEANRVLVSRLAALHFAPTTSSRTNLLREGVSDESILVTGNTVVDALLGAVELIAREPPALPGLGREQMASWGRAPVVLITGHRRENFGGPFESICRAIRELALRFPDAHFVYPVHLNPNVRRPVMQILDGDAALPNVHLIEPVGYLAFVALMHRSTLILTDSGGVQEEAPSLGKPVLVMRDTTERPEAVDAGCVKLVGTDELRIAAEVSCLLTDSRAYERMARVANPYGDGGAARRIVAACLDFLGVASTARGAGTNGDRHETSSLDSGGRAPDHVRRSTEPRRGGR
ncbi:MAG TPA: UDP-N-acetylglucosamine 2-epimerase (non-hydrolyzing) [Gemmatimonadaceae bacterium]